MSKEEFAKKEVEAFSWMKKQGYDRRACKDIAPILVKFHQQKLKKACTDFFYWWYNQEGNNTEEGFEKWYNEVYKLKQK